MEQIIGITNARNNIKEIVDAISDRNETYIVTRDSVPEAVIVPYSKYMENKKLLEKIAELQYESLMKKSKSQLKEWLQQKGFNTSELHEEEIGEMIKNLHINNI